MTCKQLNERNLPAGDEHVAVKVLLGFGDSSVRHGRKQRLRCKVHALLQRGVTQNRRNTPIKRRARANLEILYRQQYAMRACEHTLR